MSKEKRPAVVRCYVIEAANCKRFLNAQRKARRPQVCLIIDKSLRENNNEDRRCNLRKSEI